MKAEMVMPQMGESITEGTIIKWLKKEGDRVERDEVILEISTDKVDSEIPSPHSGVLKKILAKEGETVKVGSVIAEIETEEAAAETAEKPVEAPPEPEKKPEPEPSPVTPEKEPKIEPAVAAQPQTPPPAPEPAIPVTEEIPRTDRKKRFYSPLVRSIARAEGIPKEELEQIEGTGAGGRVTKRDILDYIERRSRYVPPRAVPEVEAPPREEPKPAPAYVPPAQPEYADEKVEVIPMDHMRKSIAAHMVNSVKTSPHVFALDEVDMTNLVRFREKYKDEFQRREGFKLTYMPFIIHACAKALRDYPLVNSSVEGDKIIRKKYINIGIAVALENYGLIVPVIKNADGMNVLGLARAANDLVQRARSRKLNPDDVQNGTFSITNMGSFGTLLGFPIINQPQVAILGLGVIKKRPVVINEAIAIRDMMYISLSFDHRLVDGAMAGQFLQRIAYYLQNFDTSGLF
ncbi:MAG: 2-oxo acid dehydrogenase subunit E2 [Calditrichaeota bacterium]|nr:MAG: 2-oxo acid dehydrogenase subunit E2 [Calditrichota bacterium]